MNSLLGAGGMGEVYVAFDPRLHRDVALKILARANVGIGAVVLARSAFFFDIRRN